MNPTWNPGRRTAILFEASVSQNRPRGTRFLVVSIGALLAIALVHARARANDIPLKINFQGKLLDSSNIPRNGDFSMTFKLYDQPSGGTALYTEGPLTVTVVNGVFAVQIGTQTPLSPDLFAGASAYLGITVAPDGEMTPRQQLVASAYAATAAQLVQLGNIRINAGTSYSTFTAAGNLEVQHGVTAGTATLTATGEAQYSLTTASGIHVQAGTLQVTEGVVAGVFVGSQYIMSGGGISYPSGGDYTRPKRSVILTAAGAVIPSSGGASQKKTNDTNHSYYTLAFDAASDEAAFWQWVMPNSYDGGAIDVTYYWTSSAISGNAVWCFKAGGSAAGETVDPPLSSDVCDTAAAPGTANYLMATVRAGAGSNFSAGDYVVFKVFRDANNASDTLAADAKLVMVKIEYSVSKESD